MIQVRIVSPGWEHLTGPFGGVEFEDGVSARGLTDPELHRIAGSLQVVDLEGNPVGIAARLVTGATIRAEVVEPLMTQTEAEKAVERVVEPVAETPVEVFYTGEQLEEIAEAKGITGLREIAEPLGVKGRSITDLIKAISEEQARRQQAATLTQTPAA